jgi:two-component system sensor histidine kinase TtrS
VDAFIAPSQIYRQSLRYGAKDIAVTIPSQGSNPNASDGAALFIRLDRSDKVRLENWERLRVTLAGAMSSTAFTSLRDELLSKLAIDNAKLHLPSQTAAVPIEEGIRRLQAGETDVLMLSACALENYSKHAALPVNLMLLNAKEDTGLNCLHSTHLFQGITFAAMPSLSVETFNRLGTQVLSVSVPGSARWAMATDFSGLDKALERLDSDAWASLREPDWTIFFKKYQAWFLGAAVIACLAVFNIFLLGLMVKKRTRELVSSIREQNRLRKVAARTHEKLEKLQRLTTVGQMASLFAHELRQPLNALSCYAYGLQRALEAEKISHRDDVNQGLKGLFQQISRANAIVDKVRSYVKSCSSRDNLIDFHKLLLTAIENFKTTSSGDIPVYLNVDPEKSQTNLDLKRNAPAPQFVIAGDAMELELIIINLLRNASEAQREVEKPFIKLTLSRHQNRISLCVEDNGPGLSDDAFENIVSIGESTRPEGLGLGLSIINDLVYAHRGDLKFALSEKRSLIVTVTFPAAGS